MYGMGLLTGKCFINAILYLMSGNIVVNEEL